MKVTLTVEDNQFTTSVIFGSTTTGSKSPSIARAFRVKLPARPTSLSRPIFIIPGAALRHE